MNDRYTIVTLSELLTVTRNGEHGFSSCAQHARSDELKRLFASRARRHAQAAAELSELIIQLGGDPAALGKIAGAVHRGWVNLKSAVSGRTDLAILEECERGEDVAKARYGKALEETLPEDIRMVVQRQYDGVMRNHDQIRDLRDRYRAKQS